MTRSTWLVVAGWLWSAPALAGGYYYADSGISANGRGCAFVAGGDTYFDQYYNPAALANVTRPQVAAGFSGIHEAVTFTRMDLDSGTTYDPAVNQGGYFGVPELGGAGRINKYVTAAFGFVSGFAPAYGFDPDGPQRYTIVDNLVWNFSIGPSVAIQPIPRVSIGLGLQWQVLRVGEQLKVTTSGQDDPTGDVSVDARVWDKFTPNFNVGVLVKPVKGVRVGLSVEPPAEYHARGKGTLDFTGNGLEPYLDKSVYEDDDIGLDLAMPMFLRSGVAWNPMPELQLEADFDYETWSRLQDIQVNHIDAEVTGTTPLGPIDQKVQDTISLPAGFNDVWSIRGGVEYRGLPVVDLRAGGFYETSSLTPQKVSVSLVDTPKVQVGAGATVHVPGKRVLVDVFASHVFFWKLEIRDSTVTQINVFDPDKELVVGNGDISTAGQAFGADVRVLFGKAQEGDRTWGMKGDGK